MKALVILADGFEEIEFSTIIDILRRAGIKTDSASLHDGLVKGMMGVMVSADSLIDDVEAQSYDCLILPGGNPGFKNLSKDRRVLSIIQSFMEQDKHVGAICAGPVALDSAGVLADKKITAYPGIRHLINNCREYTAEPITIDGKLITGKGPNYAMEFALSIASHFCSQQKMAEVKRDIFV